MRASPAWLNHLYSVPDPLGSLEQWECFKHVDLGRMTRPFLLRELDRLRLRLLLDEDPDPWLVTRLSAIEEALRCVHVAKSDSRAGLP